MPSRLLEAEELIEDYRRLRSDITGRGQSSPVHVRDALAGLDGDDVVRAVDPRSRRQARHTREEKEAYAAYLRDHMTPAETMLWAQLSTWGADGIEVRPQEIVQGWVVDFYLPAFRLIIEVDGGVHDKGHQWHRDQHRDATLTRAGYSLLRFRNHEVMQSLHRVLGRILDTVAGIEADDAG